MDPERSFLSTGPESSGTRYVKWLLECGGATDVTHRSMPHGDDWWVPQDVAHLYDHIVVSIRGLYAQASSQVEHSIEPRLSLGFLRRARALQELGPLLTQPNVTVVTYESLASIHERQVLLSYLGLAPQGAAQATFERERQEIHYRRFR